MRKLHNVGDTIVEVMIAIIIVSTVIGVAYSTVSKATNNARQAQERGVATKLLESQVERLKVAAAAGTISAVGGPFCMDVMSATSAPVLFAAGFSLLPIDDPASLNGYIGGCILDESGDPYTATSPGLPYFIAIFQTGNSYSISCRFANAGGGRHEEAILSYRTY